MANDSDARRQTQGTVLVVGDDASIAAVIQELLLDEGYAASLLSVPSPDAFRAAVGRLEPDCILLDSLSGSVDFATTWVESSWAHQRSRPVPVVLFTANTTVGDEARAKLSDRSGSIFGVVTKPFDIDVLLDTVATLIGNSTRFDRSEGGDQRRSAGLVTALEASGARDVHGSNRREWVTFAVNDAMAILYWSQRDGSYYVLREPAESGPPRLIGRFSDLDAAVAVAVAVGPAEL